MIPNLTSFSKTSLFRRCLIVLIAVGTVAQLSVHAQRKEENLEYADLLYNQKEFAKAARQYHIFIRENPTSPNAQSGWFRLGECYLRVGQMEDAKDTFGHIVKTFRVGPYVGSAAYRLAVMNFNAKEYPNATNNFEIAANELASPEAKHQAKYYLARSLQLTQQFDRALSLYGEVLKNNPDPKTNPFHERCLLESARIHIEKDEKEAAFDFFKTLSKTATTEAIREEAIVRGGLIASELGKVEESERLLASASAFPADNAWKSLAQVGSIYNAFSREEYDHVIAIYSSGALTRTIEEERPRMLLIVGHSFRIKGDLDSASRLYQLVQSKYPTSDEGMEAGYRQLQILYQQGNGTLPAIANRYISNLKRKNPEDPYIDMAYLMKAEFHFTQAEKGVQRKDEKYAKANFLAAAQSYAQVRENKVNEKFHPIRLYKQGWAYLEAGELQNGILAISRFIKRFSDNPLAASALAKRGTTYQSVEDFTFAQADYQQIIDNYPDSPELELAMQQKALIYAHKRDLPKMIDAYEQLLRRFPNTKGKAEATYWIGVGHFDMEQYAKAIPALKMAKQLNPSAYTNKGSIRIILSHYQLEQIAELTEAARIYIQAGRDQGVLTEEQKKDKRIDIPAGVLEYLGKKLAQDKNYQDADFFLTHLVSSTGDPKKTSAATWRVLAESRMEIKKYAEAVESWDHFLVQTEDQGQRGYAYLQRGKAQLSIDQTKAARDSARECLKLIKQGNLNAEARILLGDIAAAEGDLEGAAREYLVVSQIFNHKEITPRALTKAISAYISLGNQEEAAKLRNQLRNEYPDYKQ